ncbi:MAG: dihydroorotate dehydrogenase [Eubacteriales bacterium]|uniref:dihydroorotate dehydrogenase n=1 Tax=Fenollaria sp. TaxID=1965292 RepID=UPI002A75A570|nr:dihydroorotate dehydrogenase [Fenollaria sp.]MDD7339277.1 dihydroorotate dehydrogenase [Eubacteriales bacterium]MDY3106273.1 dihydroorotate dehydrogenase [Fenollaria sp.]
MTDLRVKIADIEFKNPLIAASGTYGFGKEYEEYYDISKIGGVSTKGLTLKPKDGNEGIRLFETPSGLMNSIGLENPGVQAFIDNELDFLLSKDLITLVNIGGNNIEDYLEAVRLISKTEAQMIELNISCPNVKSGGMAFGIKTCVAKDVVKKVREVTDKPLIVKLSPNANDIVEMAKACEEVGADALSLVNTFNAMAIDIDRRKTVFNNKTAGLSGPAIKPIALRMTYEVSKAVNIPVIGMGGIQNYRDVIEFIMAGASAVQVGTMNFTEPMIMANIAEDLEKYMKDNKIESFEEIRGII